MSSVKIMYYAVGPLIWMIIHMYKER